MKVDLDETNQCSVMKLEIEVMPFNGTEDFHVMTVESSPMNKNDLNFKKIEVGFLFGL